MAELKPEDDQEPKLDQEKLEPENEYTKLRRLLLGPDYDRALHDYISRSDDLERVSDVLADAIKLSGESDKRLAQSLAPILNKAIHESIISNPTQITHAISPIMGPAIRKSVRDALRELVQGLNSVLEQSFSLRSLSWRYQAWRAGSSYGQYVLSKTQKFAVEQVLLVHRETGLLLHSVANDHVHSQDPELVSSMLTAIQDFVSDSFDTQSESSLEQVQIGDLTLHLRAGPKTVFAVAVRGTIGTSALEYLSDTFDSIQRRFAKEIDSFEGDRDAFLSTEDDLRSCLLSEDIQHEDKPLKKPWLAILLCLGLFLGFCYHLYSSHLLSQEHDRLLYGLKSEPGYIVVSHSATSSTLSAEVLKSHGARSIETLRSALAPKNIILDITASNITFDYIDVEKLNKLNIPEPPPAKSIVDTINQLSASIQSRHIYFEEKSTIVTEQSALELNILVNEIKELSSLIVQTGSKSPQVMIIGFADKNGTQYGNLQVSQNRAELVKSILLENGIPDNYVVSWGIGYRDTLVEDEATQRRVSVQVILPKISESDRTAEVEARKEK